jgi:hypothetical protein
LKNGLEDKAVNTPTRRKYLSKTVHRFTHQKVQTINNDDHENLRAFTERRNLVARELKFQPTVTGISGSSLDMDRRFIFKP